MGDGGGVDTETGAGIKKTDKWCQKGGGGHRNTRMGQTDKDVKLATYRERREQSKEKPKRSLSFKTK